MLVGHDLFVDSVVVLGHFGWLWLDLGHFGMYWVFLHLSICMSVFNKM